MLLTAPAHTKTSALSFHRIPFVLLDVFLTFHFRHLNRASPATVATYHAMIE
jgi:hypothetical protein